MEVTSPLLLGTFYLVNPNILAASVYVYICVILLLINKINKALILSVDNYLSDCFALNLIKFALAKQI